MNNNTFFCVLSLIFSVSDNILSTKSPCFPQKPTSSRNFQSFSKSAISVAIFSKTFFIFRKTSFLIKFLSLRYFCAIKTNKRKTGKLEGDGRFPFPPKPKLSNEQTDFRKIFQICSSSLSFFFIFSTTFFVLSSSFSLAHFTFLSLEFRRTQFSIKTKHNYSFFLSRFIQEFLSICSCLLRHFNFAKCKCKTQKKIWENILSVIPLHT